MGNELPGGPLGGRRITLRAIAAQAGVSVMTASRALANRGRIAAATRNGVLQIARDLGYRPDPEITKLMHHLRARRTGTFQSMLFGLTTHRPNVREAYFRALVAGAEAQAARRGYGFEVVSVSPTPADWAPLQRILQSRGAEGILLLPQSAPVDLTGLLAWAEFSVVAASASATGPRVHRVIPHHFANTLLLCRTLAQHGHRRIGLVIAADQDIRTEHGFTAAVTWHGLNEAPHFVPPLVKHGDPARALRAWFVRERPDVIITNEPRSARECARHLGCRISGPPRFVVTSIAPDRRDSLGGIDERPAAVGIAAVDQLASMVERRVRGLPESPASIQLAGCWAE